MDEDSKGNLGNEELVIGENRYTRRKYTPLETADRAFDFMACVADKDSRKLKELYTAALQKVRVNDEPLDGELKLNVHFAKFPEDLCRVRVWALQEGLQSFLDLFRDPPDWAQRYYLI
jgi:hypothetical protein